MVFLEVRQQGQTRVREELRDARDRFIASDPGWARARLGLRALVAVGSTIAVQALLAHLLDRSATQLMLLGAIVAATVSTGVREARRRLVLEYALVATGLCCAGIAVGVFTAQIRLLGLAAFVAVSFVAVWVRRFGPRWLALGFVLWQGFFFALFLRLPVADLGVLVLTVGVSGVWVTLLLSTVLFENPQAKLRRVVVALRARARAGISAALEVLEDPSEKNRGRAVRQHLVQLREVALLLDGLLADPRSLPPGLKPGRVRRWTVEVEIGMDEVCAAALDIAAARDTFAEQDIEAVRRTLDTLGWANPDKAHRRARELADHHQPALHRLGAAAILLLDTVQEWDDGLVLGDDGSEAGGENGSDEFEEDDLFAPVVTLVGGNLPGSAQLAEASLFRAGSSRFAPSRLRLTTRQAIQAAAAAALAIALGEAISPQRFYWAVIAAFVIFAGAATAGENLSKGVARITGTLLGLIVGVGVAELTRGHLGWSIATILVCVFLAFFSQPISATAMIFFVTVLLGQLYTLLGTFSEELLLLRLEETVAGALSGIVVALLVFPASSRAALRQARKVFMSTLADLLDGCAAVLRGQNSGRDLLELSVSLDAAARQVVRTRRALTRGRLFGADRLEVQHRVTVMSTAGAAARALAGAVPVAPPDPGLAQVTSALADDARRLSDAPLLASSNRPGPSAFPKELRSSLDHAWTAPASTAVVNALLRLGDALSMLRVR